MTEPAAPDSPRRGRRPRINAELRNEERVKPLELFFDLVFVLAFTQCTALMANMPTWEGLAQGMLVRAGQIALFLIAGRGDSNLRHSIVGLGVSSAIGVGLLVGAAFVDGPVQYALWILAIVVDFGGPAFFGADGWKLVPAHFAERHNLIIILALGESLGAFSVGAEVALSAEVYVAAVLGIGIAAALWWIYFDVVALVTERRLVMAEEGRVRNELARDSYSFLHFPMVAGIVLTALGLEEALPHLDDPLHVESAFALFGGVAIYLLAHVAMRWRNAHTVSRTRLGVAVLLLVLWPVGTEMSALASLVVVNVVLWPMIAWEHAHYGDGRYRLRHGLEVDSPGPPSSA
jgi:low temperature requirement protein LtrA